MGEIYLARDPDLDRDVALKVLPPGDEGEDAALRLRHEARAAAALRHPNIVTVYEVGVDEDRAFIAMEFVDGLSLRQIFEAGEVTLEQLTAVGAGVARALEAAHRAGVLHRDIKPDNVMLDRGGGIKVVDFGIAHRAEGGAPSTSFGGAVATLVEELASTSP
jgi:serine/threonine-protein kinase